MFCSVLFCLCHTNFNVCLVLLRHVGWRLSTLSTKCCPFELKVFLFHWFSLFSVSIPQLQSSSLVSAGYGLLPLAMDSMNWIVWMNFVASSSVFLSSRCECACVVRCVRCVCVCSFHFYVGCFLLIYVFSISIAECVMFCIFLCHQHHRLCLVGWCDNRFKNTHTHTPTPTHTHTHTPYSIYSKQNLNKFGTRLL